MVGFERRFCWTVLVIAYWFCALGIIYDVSPISEDGSGPTPTFYWGNHRPEPSVAEYYGNVGTRLQFLYPYWVAASLITFLFCGPTTWVVRLWKPMRSRLFLVTSAVALFWLLLAAAVSDLGIAFHVWRGPVMYEDVSYALPFLKIMVPISLFAGVLALARDRLDNLNWAGASGPGFTGQSS
jgi:hypothetical protein